MLVLSVGPAGSLLPLRGVLKHNVGSESLREVAGYWLRSGVSIFPSKLVNASWRRFGGCRWSALTIRIFLVQVVAGKV